jgi:hypothetical protein
MAKNTKKNLKKLKEKRLKKVKSKVVKSKASKPKKTLRQAQGKAKSKPSKFDAFATQAESLIAKGKERGFVTYDEILKEFPTIEDNIEFLEWLYEKFSVSGVEVVEGGGLLDSSAGNATIAHTGGLH